MALVGPAAVRVGGRDGAVLAAAAEVVEVEREEAIARVHVEGNKARLKEGRVADGLTHAVGDTSALDVVALGNAFKKMGNEDEGRTRPNSTSE